MALEQALFAAHLANYGQDKPAFATSFDSRVIPFFVATSALLVETASIAHQLATQKTEHVQSHSPRLLAKASSRLGGPVILSFNVARAVASSVFALLAVKTHVFGTESSWTGIDAGTAMVYASSFATACSLLALVTPWHVSLIRCNITIFFSALCVYVYRDVWPLATFNNVPLDLGEGQLLWVKIGILALISFVIPLSVPRKYIPYESEEPMEHPSPEQTCSLFSLIFYIFLDPVISAARSRQHIGPEDLLPLQDVDFCKNNNKKTAKLLDPSHGARRRFLFFKLLWIFRYQQLGVMATQVGQLAALFASPYAIKETLRYIETGGKDATVKPWLWILCLFVAPISRSLFFQGNVFLVTKAVARTEIIVSQLIFDHALRIRVKAETSSNTTPSKAANTAKFPKNTLANQISEPSTTPSTSQVTLVSPNAPANATKSNTAHVKKASGNFLGRMNSLITTDVTNISGCHDFLLIAFFIPLQTICSLLFLYNILGWSAFIGFGTTILLFPLPGYLVKITSQIQKTRMEKTDARVQATTEAINLLRMVKLFGWEQNMAERVNEKRSEELAWIRKSKLMVVFNGILNFLIPSVIMVATYTTYTIIMREELSASIVFSSMAIFSQLRLQLSRITWQVNALLQGNVSINRLGDFLHHTELLDACKDGGGPTRTNDAHHQDDIGFKKMSFSWSSETDGTEGADIRLRIEEELLFVKNTFNLIVGPTGSGKTSLLMALLEEMHAIPTADDSWFSLPRAGGVSFAAQESWVQNDTIRANILFGSPYDEERYKKVLYQCALEKDLELFEAGDLTEVGEKGLTLSGGQKARVTLGRAIYAPTAIVLLDDVLAALDVHTSTWIVQQCFKGDLVRNRTVILVTHNITLTKSLAAYIVTVSHDGTARGESHQPEPEKWSAPVTYTAPHREPIGDTDPTSTSATAGKLVLAEEVVRGRVGFRPLKLYLRAVAGGHFWTFYIIWVLIWLLLDITTVLQTWYLGYWGSQYEDRDPSDVHASWHLSMYILIVSASVAVFSAEYVYQVLSGIRASRAIHKALIDSVLGSTLRWLDETPTGRIITRCTQDIRSVDHAIMPRFANLAETVTAIIITRLVLLIIFAPPFFAPAVAISILGGYLGNCYLKAQIATKRELSNAKSPILSHFGSTIAGLVSLRAYGAQNTFREESMIRIDRYTRLRRTMFDLNRWIGVRLEILSGAFVATLCAYLIYWSRANASNTGFSLNLAFEFTSLMLWFVRGWNEFEVESNSLERIQGYLDIDHEPRPTERGKPPAAWPTSGDLRVEKLSARYSATSPDILHDISFHIKAGERVGVVGRTGSGKSSLTLSLLRCILTEGTVYYDGIQTKDINLDALRSSVTIIPQVPELFSGTIRRNIDPFEQHSDAELNNALRSAGFFSLQEFDQDTGAEDRSDGDSVSVVAQGSTSSKHLTLDSQIASGGGNLSVGQRQIIALARALVRRSKLVILDEATSAIDYKTDAIIQESLRKELASETTVLTVAHRLQTIMDADRIMVLENGRLVEFDSPAVLVQKKDSYFRALVEESKDRATLLHMIGAPSA